MTIEEFIYWVDDNQDKVERFGDLLETKLINISRLDQDGYKTGSWRYNLHESSKNIIYNFEYVLYGKTFNRVEFKEFFNNLENVFNSIIIDDTNIDIGFDNSGLELRFFLTIEDLEKSIEKIKIA